MRVGLRRLVGQPEVALGVEGVVERPVGHRRAGDRRVEDVGPAQHGQCGEVAAERPAADRHPRGVEVGLEGGDLGQRGHLVLEHDVGDDVAHAAVPLRAARAGAAAVGDDDGEALVGPPLRLEPHVVDRDHLLVVRTAVGVEQHRQAGPGHVVAGEEQADPQVVLADRQHPHVGAQRGLLGVRPQAQLLARPRGGP